MTQEELDNRRSLPRCVRGHSFAALWCVSIRVVIGAMLNSTTLFLLRQKRQLVQDSECVGGKFVASMPRLPVRLCDQSCPHLIGVCIHKPQRVTNWKKAGLRPTLSDIKPATADTERSAKPTSPKVRCRPTCLLYYPSEGVTSPPI